MRRTARTKRNPVAVATEEAALGGSGAAAIHPADPTVDAAVSVCTSVALSLGSRVRMGFGRVDD